MVHTAGPVGLSPREPALAGFLVARERLIEATMTAGAAATRILLRAPPGAGKTVLLTQLAAHLRAQGRAVAWLGLEPGDNDPSRLLARVLAGLHEALIRAEDGASDAIGRMMVPRDPLDAGFIASVVQALPAGEPVWFLIDDAHVLTSGPAADGLDQILDATADRLRTVVASRSDPALSLARRVLAGQAVELEPDSLVFDPAEARALFQAHALTLDDTELTGLLVRTEGWAAGLRLAALSLTRAPDRARFVASFTGDRRPVADYLASEVLRELPAHVTKFMLATSGPAELTVELAAVLSARTNAGAILDRLARASLLTTRSETSPPTFRYHALLRGYLAATSAARDLSAHLAAHSTAALYFDRNGRVPLALEHAASGHDWSLVADLLSRHGLPLILRGEGAVVLAAVDGLPLLERTTRADLLTALLRLTGGDLDGADAALAALPPLGPATHPRDAALHVALRLYRVRLSGVRGAPVAEWLDHGSLDDGSADALFLTAMRGMSRVEVDDLPAAEADLGRAVRMAADQRYDFLWLDCMSRLTLIAGAAGRLGDTVERAESAIAFAADRGWARTATLLPSYFVVAWTAWGDLDDERAERVLTLAESLRGAAEPRITVFISLLRNYVDYGRTGSYAALARHVRAIWAAVDDRIVGPHGISPLCMAELAYAEAVGDGAWMEETVRRTERRLAGTGEARVAKAWRHLAEGRPATARDVLEPVLAGRLRTDVRAMLCAWQLECRAAVALGRDARAHEALLAMLEVAVPASMLRPVLMAAPEVHSLLRAGRGRFGAAEDFVDRVLQAVADRGATAPVPALTEREAVVLRDLPSLLSLAEIAAAHQVSENTVKTHVKSIYDKLGAHTRREAVRRATDLGLL